MPISPKLDGVTPEQGNTILQLVAIAENGTTNWPSAFTYCEDIKDGRGYTCNIVGKNFILCKCKS